MVDFVRCAKAEAFAWAMIESGSDLVATDLGEVGERGAFGEILADESVGVFVRNFGPLLQIGRR